MILFSEALDIVLGEAKTLEYEEVDLAGSVGRVLAGDIISDMDMPPFDKSAMDGYACRRDDLGQALEVVEVIRAGCAPEKNIGPGQCAQIMTGAMLPVGADTVIEVELTEETDDGKIIFKGVKPKSNICPLGEDIRKGDLVLNEGTLIGVRHIPVLATVGATRINVYRQPGVGVLATGTELVEPHEVPGPSQIRNSNAAQTMAQLRSLGLNPYYYGIAPDDEGRTYEMIASALRDSDIIMLSGGVSMGEFDFVPSVLKMLGFDLLFQRLAIQPGKPTTFGVKDGKYVFAFPGNPVSSFIIFELLARPFIYKLMNHKFKPVIMRLQSGQEMKRRKAVRQSWFPVELNSENKVVQLDYHGSAHIFSLNRAIGISSMEIGVDTIGEGDWIDVRQI